MLYLEDELAGQNAQFKQNLRSNADPNEGNRIGELHAELAYLSDVLARQPNLAEGYRAMGKVLAALGSMEEALACVQKAKLLGQYQTAGWHEVAAREHFRQGRFEEAFNSWKQVLALRPGEIDMLDRIQDGFFHVGQLELAQRLLQCIVDRNLDIARRHQLDKLGLRFLRLYSNQIGHMGHLDWYVKMTLLGQRASSRPVILADNPANPCYLNYWRRYIPDIIVDPVASELLTPSARYLEDGLVAVLDAKGEQKADYFYATQVAIQKQWDAEGRPPLLTMSAEDKERGWECLRRHFGVPPGAWFVSLHVRHDGNCFESQGTRDAQIPTYIPAIRTIVERGGWVIRMGDRSMPPLPSMANVIDYAHSPVKSDWMDVFLWAQCRFYLGTNSGPAFIPPTFGVPVVMTNWSPLGIPDLFIQGLCTFKLYWNELEQRYLSFPEVLSSSLGFTNAPEHITSKGVSLVDNTPEEIQEVVTEMLERLEGKRSYTTEENQLQEGFDLLKNKVPGVGRIGRSFLRKHAQLLTLT